VPTTISELPNGMEMTLKVFCSKRDIHNIAAFIHAIGILGGSGLERTIFSMARTASFTGNVQ
jgi:hypothetical protein